MIVIVMDFWNITVGREILMNDFIHGIAKIMIAIISSQKNFSIHGT